MPLIDAKGLQVDGFSRLEGESELLEGDIIVPVARLAELADIVLARGHRLGVHVQSVSELAQIEGFLDRLSLISIGFASFGDGRGFSLGKRLRHRGYRGVLRAAGPLIADQMRHALGCGFDEVEIPPALLQRQPISHWLEGLGAITLRYQRDGGHGSSILDQRRGARAEPGRRRIAYAA